MTEEQKARFDRLLCEWHAAEGGVPSAAAYDTLEAYVSQLLAEAYERGKRDMLDAEAYAKQVALAEKWGAR